MKVLIFKPAKTTMQSGKAGTSKWLIKYIEQEKTRSTNNVMGWTSSDNTETQIKLKFNSKEEAIKYAMEQDYDYIVEEPELAKVIKKSYSSTFTS